MTANKKEMPAKIDLFMLKDTILNQYGERSELKRGTIVKGVQIDKAYILWGQNQAILDKPEYKEQIEKWKAEFQKEDEVKKSKKAPKKGKD